MFFALESCCCRAGDLTFYLEYCQNAALIFALQLLICGCRCIYLLRDMRYIFWIGHCFVGTPS